MVEIIASIIQIIPNLCSQISHQTEYVRHLKNNVDALMVEAGKLQADCKDIESKEREASREKKMLTNRAQTWLGQARTILAEIDSIKLQFDQRRTFCNGCFPDLRSDYKLGIRAFEKLKGIPLFIEERNGIELVARSPPLGVIKMDVPNVSQSSAQRTKQKIWNLLHDEHSSVICIYGMGGVGKSTLMKAINNELHAFYENKEKKDELRATREFDYVIWVTVSKQLDLQKIQKGIMSRLDLKFDEKDSYQDRSIQLREWLSNQRYLLILDDLWNSFNLSEVGIPTDMENRSKIAITTRIANMSAVQVCSDMKAEKIRVETLTEDEAWDLFAANVGKEVVHQPHINDVAKKVARECGGLPLAIVVVAKAMQGQNKKELWQDALRALRAAAPEIEVEMPLPADVVVSNLLAAEARVSTTLAANVSVLRSISATAASTGDMMNPVATLDQSSISRSKGADVEFRMLENLSRIHDYDDSSKLSGCNDANNPLPRGTGLHYRAGKVPRSSSPCSKRPRTHQGENSMSIARTDVDNAVSRKTRCNPTKCTSAEKSRVIRQRHNQDGKRGDKRSFRAPAKTKFDIFSSKAGMGSSDSTYGGNNILGVYGLKSDIHDVTQLVDELSLSELLDGSYKCPNLYRDKGKKVADTNESIISSVKKACSVLFHHSAVVSRNIPGLDSICSKRTHPSSCSNESNRDNGDNCIEELASAIKDSCIPGALASLNNSPLLQPKDILERLTLPPTNDLDALLRDAPGPAVSLQTNEMHSGRQSKKSSLPPFAWSESHGGQSKVNSDSGKLFTNRNMFPTRWVRLDSYCSLHGNATSCFSDLVTCDSHTGGPSQEQKIDGKVETQLPVTCSYLDLDKNFPKRGSNVMSSYNSLESGGCLGSTDCRPGFQFKERIFLGTQEVEGSKNHGNEAISMDPPNRSLDQEDANNCTEIEQQIERTMHTGSDSIIGYSPSTCTVSGANQFLWHSPSKGISKEGMLSPRLLAAAQILCELASHSDLTGKQEEKLRWPKKPSQKPMKARKLRSSLGKVEDLSVTLEPLAKPGHAGKSTGQIPSQRRKFSAEKNKNHINMKDIIHQGSVKWSVPSASRYPGSSERDITSSSKHGSVDPIKLVGLMASPPNVEKACSSSQQKQRKTLVIAPVVNNHGKDGSRGRGYKE